jgi:hypothetical protein
MKTLIITEPTAPCKCDLRYAIQISDSDDPLTRFWGQTLYKGIAPLYGGWLITTEGDPDTLTTLEDSDNDFARDDLRVIQHILNDPDVSWEPLEAEDVEYINDMLDAWGIEETI